MTKVTEAIKAARKKLDVGIIEMAIICNVSPTIILRCEEHGSISSRSLRTIISSSNLPDDIIEDIRQSIENENVDVIKKIQDYNGLSSSEMYEITHTSPASMNLRAIEAIRESLDIPDSVKGDLDELELKIRAERDRKKLQRTIERIKNNNWTKDVIEALTNDA